MAEDVELSIQGDVAFVNLHRPEFGNALRGAMFDAIRKIALRLSDQPPGFVIITGEGPDFCRGLMLSHKGTLHEMLTKMVAQRDAHRVQELLARLRGAFDSLGRLPCPVIAAIEGRCHGAGLEVALVTDVRIASTEATFGMPEVRRGVLTGLGGLTRLNLLLGPARTNHLLLSGGLLRAEGAMAAGLVSQLCKPGTARATALGYVADLRRASSSARLQSVLATRGIQNRLMREMFEQEDQAAARTWISGDWQDQSGGGTTP